MYHIIDKAQQHRAHEPLYHTASEPIILFFLKRRQEWTPGFDRGSLHMMVES